MNNQKRKRLSAILDKLEEIENEIAEMTNGEKGETEKDLLDCISSMQGIVDVLRYDILDGKEYKTTTKAIRRKNQ